MSLFGTFPDVSLPDIISLIGNSSGNFVVRQQRGSLAEQYELGVEDGHITRMSFNGQEIRDTVQARSFLTELVRSNCGEFEYHRGLLIKGPLWIQITEALLTSYSILDEMAGLREHFPDPHTVFLENENVRVLLSPELEEFWGAIEPYFREGICAADLSDKIGLFLDQILLKLYKLRLAEVIVPKRAFFKTQPIPSMQELSPLERALDPEMLALTRKLQPIWADPPKPEPEIRPLPASVTAEPAELGRLGDEGAKLSPVLIYRPDKNMVGRFMTSLKKLMGSTR